MLSFAVDCPQVAKKHQAEAAAEVAAAAEAAEKAAGAHGDGPGGHKVLQKVYRPERPPFHPSLACPLLYVFMSAL